MALKFLTDENISTSLVKVLRKNGYDTKDIKEQKLFGASDKEILKRILKNYKIVKIL